MLRNREGIHGGVSPAVPIGVDPGTWIAIDKKDPVPLVQDHTGKSSVQINSIPSVSNKYRRASMLFSQALSKNGEGKAHLLKQALSAIQSSPELIGEVESKTIDKAIQLRNAIVSAIHAS